MPIKNRQLQIPGGYKFYVAETKWQPSAWSSFDSIVSQVIAHREGNPPLARKHGWRTDRAAVEAEVDAFNTKICQAMHWDQYITEGGTAAALPFPALPPLSPLKKSQALAAGAGLLIDWVKDGAEAVPLPQANGRALVCSVCPLNDTGDWTRFFTEPAANAIRKELEKRKEMKLATEFDDRLQVCAACLCPLKLKLHVPIDRIVSRMLPEVRAGLHPNCWILAESQPPADGPKPTT